MKLHQAQDQGKHVFNSYEKGKVVINGQTYEGALIVTPDEVISWNAQSLEDLTEEHFARLLPWQPEVVLFGSGPALRFIHPKLMAALTNAGIGVDTMDTQAACRTYNILMAEDRKVLLAMLPI